MDNNGLTAPLKHLPAKFLDGEITLSDLEHLAGCDYCIEQFADEVEQQALLHAPRDFKADVLKKSGQIDIRLTAKSHQLSKQLQLFYYSLKVGMAVLGSLALLSVLPRLPQNFAQPPGLFPVSEWETGQKTEKSFGKFLLPSSLIYETAESLTQKLNQLSKQPKN